jgi:hypothetical protein
VIDGLDDVTVVKEIRDEKKSQFVEDLAEAFNDVRLF